VGLSIIGGGKGKGQCYFRTKNPIKISLFNPNRGKFPEIPSINYFLN
jgi:hypothetical protein